MCVAPMPILTPFFQKIEDKLSEKESLPLLGIGPSLAKIVVGVAQIVAGLAAALFFALATPFLSCCISGGSMIIVLSFDGLQTAFNGLKAIGFAGANIATLTGLAAGLHHRAQKLACNNHV